MRLLFLTVIPSPYQRQLFEALNRLPDLDTHILYFRPTAHDREWQDPSITDYETVMPGRTLVKLGNSAHWNPSVISCLKAAGADLVIVSDYSAPTAQVAMRYLAWTGKPFMFWGEIPGFLDRGPVGRFMRSQLQSPLKAACGIAAIGEVAEKAYQRLFPKKQVFNIPYFCDLDPYRSAASANRKQPSEKLEIIFSGQLIDRKGVDVLLAAFARVGRENARLHLRLLGSGPKGDHYRSMVPQEIANRIDFAGHVDPQELPEIFAKADIFCLPSRHDGWGVVVNEALGAGLPIIVSDKVGAGADLVQHGRNGLITSAGDVDALADALRLLGSDDNLRASMAEESRIISEDWGIDEGVRRWEHAAKTTLDAWQAA